jgi:hypothetical protein
MKRRCADLNDADYGGRGIRVCDRWMVFKNFLDDMGLRPSSEHSIDRFPDKNGNYEPSNCRWATREQQQRNLRNNVVVEFRGVRMLLIEAVEMVGTPYGRVYRRLSKGWPVDRALLEPPQIQNKN